MNTEHPPLDRWRTHTDKLGRTTTGYYDSDGYFFMGSCRTMGGYPEDQSRPATQEEVNKVLAEIKRIEDYRADREAREAVLFAKIGLTAADFCRFRNITEEGDTCVVETRENGVDGFSLNAVRKAGERLLSRVNDDGDSTYAYYTIKMLPEAGR